MVTQAIAAYGTTLTWDGAVIAELTNISGPGVKFDTIDVTNYSSPSAFKEFIAGFGDGGDVKIEGNFIPGDTLGQIAFITDAFAKSVKEAIITLPTAAAVSWTFDALCTSLEFTQPLEKQLGFSATLKVSGVPVIGLTISADAGALTGIEENAGAALVFTPAFAGATYSYAVHPVNTASTWIKLTLTCAGVLTATVLGIEYPLVTTVQSGQIAIDAADSLTVVSIKCQEAGHVAKFYTIYIPRL